MITTDKILTHKVHGKNLILLQQVGSSYFVLLAQVTRAKKGIFGVLAGLTSHAPTIKVLVQRQVSTEEAQAIFAAFNDSQTTPSTGGAKPAALALSGVGAAVPADQTINSDVLLLATPVTEAAHAPQKSSPKPTPSPYFPTKDIFLSAQKTRAPATI
jgi:hypothetical protein